MTLRDKLQIAKDRKDDEWYTKYEDVENELRHYSEYFKGKAIYCPCDSHESSFTKYFETNFKELGLKKLTIGWLNKDGMSGAIDTFDGTEWNHTEQRFGGFESEESEKARDESDIIVTNPPFSKATYFHKWLKKKDFIIVGNLLWASYNYFFKEFIFKRRVYEGYEYISTFNRPDGRELSISSGTWFQTLVKRYDTHLELEDKEVKDGDFLRYVPEKFSDIIYVKKCKDVPKNYTGRIAVPISFAFADNIEDYEIFPDTTINYGTPSTSLLNNDKIGFFRILLKKKVAK